jgi:hypothetical protein
MLEGVLVVFYVVIIIIRIGEKVVIAAENINRAHISLWQIIVMGLPELVHTFTVIVQAFTDLVP